MPEEPQDPQEPLTDEELERSEAEQLPDREAMSVIVPNFDDPLPPFKLPLAPPLDT
jgi:hypothetical protein